MCYIFFILFTNAIFIIIFLIEYRQFDLNFLLWKVYHLLFVLVIQHLN